MVHLMPAPATARQQPAPVKAMPIRHDVETTWSFDLAAFNEGSEPQLSLHAKSALLVDADRFRVLWSRGAHDRRPLASLTKLTTAMVALDTGGATAPITVTADAAAQDPSRMGISAGEVMTVRDLLYGALLNSGNDAAEALGQGLVPRDRFLALMNAKARTLRLRDTHYSTPSGLVDDDNYSSAYDLAVVAMEVVRRYPEITAIAGMKDAVIAATPTHKAFNSRNVNRILDVYPGATGLKTGFTDAAGGCIVVTATRGGRHLIAVLLGSDIVFGDAARILDYGFSTSV
jgi:D-alanyl-D-alanine carboxypeptidase (penicillin-binding protein 5/6)